MSITFQTPGAVAYSSPQNATTISVAYPASNAVGEKLILILGMKPTVANGGSVTQPTDWTSVTSITGAGGYGSTLGADTGNTNLFVYERTVPAGGLSGNLTVTLSGSNISWAFMARLTNTSNYIWDSIAAATGSQTAAGNVNITFGSNPGVTANDYIIGAMCVPTDIGGGTNFSAEAFSQSSVTFGTVTEINEPQSNTGNDIGGFSCRSLVSSGTGSANPVMTATFGTTNTNIRGPAVFVRIREKNNLVTLTGNNCNQSNTTTTGAVTQQRNLHGNNCNQTNTTTTGAVVQVIERYWVGGTGTWDASSTTHWSATNGGAGGASVPNSNTDVYFNGSSDSGASFAVTLSGAINCKNLTISGLDQAMTLAVDTNLNIYGNLSFPASNLTISGTYTLILSATDTGHTVNTNNITMSCNLTCDGVGGEWTLSNDLNCVILLIINGSFITANKTINATALKSHLTGIRSLTLGSSSIYLRDGLGNTVDFGNETNLSVDAGTSHIYINARGTQLKFGSTVTWYDISSTWTGDTWTDQIKFEGNISCHNLIISGYNGTPGMWPQYYELNNLTAITCSGTFQKTAGLARNSQTLLHAPNSNAGTNNQITITAASFDLNDIHIHGITFAGAGIPATGTSISDGGNCSNVTFTTPKTVYYVGGGGSYIFNNNWSNSSGGTVNTNYFPLGQDTIIVDNNSASTLACNWSWGSFSKFDASNRTSAFTFDIATNIVAGGNNGGLNLSSSVTFSSGQIFFQGTGTATITASDSISNNTAISVNGKASGATVQIASNSKWGGVQIYAGTLDVNSKTFTVKSVNVNSTNTKTIAYGTNGKLQLTYGWGNSNICYYTLTNISVTGTGGIYLGGGSGSESLSLFNSDTLVYGESVSNIYIQANLNSLNFDKCSARNLDFTGATIASANLGNARVYGDLTLVSGITALATTDNSLIFGSTNATVRNITSAGKTFNQPIEFNGVGGSWKLLDNFSLNTSRTQTLINGSLDLNGFTDTVGSFSSNNANTRALTFGTGKLSLSASSAITLSSSITVNYSTGSSIEFTSASGQTLAGGGTSLPTIRLAGAGGITVTGANTFADMVNSVQPTSLTLPEGVTTTFGAFSLRGTAGNLVVVKSSSTSTKATLYKASGDVDCNYLNINDNATGISAWYAGANSTDGLDNTGWIFQNKPVTITLTGNNCRQVNQSTSAAISQTHKIYGNNCQQVNQTTSGAISQTHKIYGNNCQQVNQSTSAAINRTLTLTGNNCQQVNQTTSGQITRTHTLTGNSCQQVNQSTSAAISQIHKISGNNCQQVNQSTSAQISRVQTLTGNNCQQVNQSTSGQINRTLTLTGNNCQQVNQSTSGQISRSHTLTGNNCQQLNTTTTGAINRTLSLTGNNCQQANLTTSGQIARVQTLTGNNCQQVNQATSAGITQTHQLSGNNCQQDNRSSSGQISENEDLIGNNVTQLNYSTSAAITQVHTLTGNNCKQVNQSTSAAIYKTFTLTGNNCQQSNRSNSNAISQVHQLLGANCNQVNQTTTGAISQIHALSGNSVNQSNQTTQGSISQTHAITGSNCNQANQSTSGAINRVLTLTGNNCQQSNQSTSSAISQIHSLTGANCQQVNRSPAGAIGQAGDLLGNNVTQNNASTSAAISQTHHLTGNNCQQTNTSSTGAIGGTTTLTANNCEQVNQSNTGAINLTFTLTGNNCQQVNHSTSEQITQTHILHGNNVRQLNLSSSAAIGQAGDLLGNNATQNNRSTSAAIQQGHYLSGNSAEQINLSNVGRIDIGIVLTGNSVLQANQANSGAIEQIHSLHGNDVRQINRSSSGFVVEEGQLLGANCIQENQSTSDRIYAYPVENAPAGSAFSRYRFNPNRPSFNNTKRPDNTNVIGPL